MTFYDDAELAAVEAVRVAVAEEDGRPRSVEIYAVTMRMFERHGWDGLAALVVALARHQASALDALAHFRGDTTAGQLVDEFEMHLLAQHEGERDTDDRGDGD